MTTIVVSWTRPTTRSDGSPLPLGEIKNFRVYEAVNGGAFTTNSALTAPPSATGLTISSAPLGNYQFKVTVVDQQDQESVLSAASPVVVVTGAVPNPPTSVNASLA